MARNETKTDLCVYDLLKKADIKLELKKSGIKKIDDALKSASKRGTGNFGFPEYVGVVNDFVLLIEDKYELSKHEKLDENGVISDATRDITDYAVNEALFYARHIVKNTKYDKVIAFGVSGDSKRHKITPLYVENTEPYIKLDDVESFISFNKNNISEYYKKCILHEDTTENDLKTVLKNASDLHNDLHVYGSLGTREKPIIVSCILLALDEIANENFDIKSLIGDKVKTDGQKIFDAIESKLSRDPIKPERKKDKLLAQFNIFKTSEILNMINQTLNPPLKYYAEFLYDNIYKTIKSVATSEDYLGRFYSKFMSYGGGDGQELGIILTPKHITDLFCDLAQLKKDDIVLDTCCGTIICYNLLMMKLKNTV